VKRGGGARGAFVDAETRALLLERCRVVWIDAAVETLAARVARKDTRPLLFGKDPRQVLGALAERRNPLYAEAHIRVRSENEPHAELVDEIVQKLMGR
jgi:shikimate kinase